MKTDLTSLKNEVKKEFKRLTDVGELKNELNRLASEIKKFDLTAAIPAAQRTRLEKRYRQLKKRMTELQKSVDKTFAKVSALVRRSGPVKKATSRKSVRKTGGKPAGNSSGKAGAKKTTTRKKASKAKSPLRS
jgi:predicted nuclease with TOPRIM domain